MDPGALGPDPVVPSQGLVESEPPEATEGREVGGEEEEIGTTPVAPVHLSGTVTGATLMAQREVEFLRLAICFMMTIFIISTSSSRLGIPGLMVGEHPSGQGVGLAG